MAAGKIEERWVTQGAESHAESLLCCCQLLQLSNNDILTDQFAINCQLEVTQNAVPTSHRVLVSKFSCLDETR